MAFLALDFLPIAIALLTGNTSSSELASSPIEIFSLPLSLLPDFLPSAMLLLPSTSFPASSPPAKLLSPVTFCPADLPIATLLLPLTSFPAS